MNDANRERDLVLAPNEYAFISDQTKGNINVYVGPYKTSLANTDKPVLFDEDSKMFVKCNLDESIQTFTIAPEGWYVVLKNPPRDGNQPKTGTSNNLADLNIGRKINSPGPVFFALWPGQITKVIPGHQLRSNQYLLVRVYDETEAQKNWGKAVVKTKNVGEGEDEAASPEVPDLTTGKSLIIKGTNVSFYIPPTGVEVVRDTDGHYVREAVTLERLEYCILLDEDGKKRYLQGPNVVFPEPTEDFVVRNGNRKFRAIELNEISGLYIKVIAPYEENDIRYEVGQELFITGKDQMIYYPRTEHAIIRYGEQEIYHAVAIPAGEGRYVLNRKTGTVTLKQGPIMYLPDPREEVIVRRVLDLRQVELWFPGNREALEYNTRLKEIFQQTQQEEFLSAKDADLALKGGVSKEESRKRSMTTVPTMPTGLGFTGEEFNRPEQLSRPRTITLHNKYEGAVTISLWAGYAVLVVSKTGTRKVITGPQTYLLEYDENLQTLEMSTGTPKTEANLLKTAYLKVLHNKISDVVKAESADFCQVSIHLSYRVNFEGEPEKWFNVENYVKFLTDHLRSVIRNAVKRHKIMDFYGNGISLVREAVLGTASEGSKRPGRRFTENGMHIYDVEVFDIQLGDGNLEGLLVSAEQDVIRQTLGIAAEKRKLELTQETEAVSRLAQEAQSLTRQQQMALALAEQTKLQANRLAQLEAEAQARQRELEAQQTAQALQAQIAQAALALEKEKREFAQQVEQQQLEQHLARLRAEVEATVAKAGAISPELVAALQAFSDRALAEKVASSMAPLAILGGGSVAEIFGNMLKGTVLGQVLNPVASRIEDVQPE
jgi:major vault protein